jgi:predicted Rdx family selenoprotein
VAAEIERAFGTRPELIKGSGGVFLVTMDGAVVYDKKKTGKFPDDGEVAKLAKGMQGTGKAK